MEVLWRPTNLTSPQDNFNDLMSTPTVSIQAKEMRDNRPQTTRARRVTITEITDESSSGEEEDWDMVEDEEAAAKGEEDFDDEEAFEMLDGITKVHQIQCLQGGNRLQLMLF